MDPAHVPGDSSGASKMEEGSGDAAMAGGPPASPPNPDEYRDCGSIGCEAWDQEEACDIRVLSLFHT